MPRKLPDLVLRPDAAVLCGGASRHDTPAPRRGAYKLLASARGAGLVFTFPAGSLAGRRYLTTDVLLEGDTLATFLLCLREGEHGPEFTLSQGFLNQCEARIRLPLEAVNQNRWVYDREGAWIKPRCAGQRVDLDRVDRISFVLDRFAGERPGEVVRWSMTDIVATTAEPERLRHPLLPRGPLLDELGQSALRDWPGKTSSVPEAVNVLRAQRAAAGAGEPVAGWSRWGGWNGIQLEATGWFRVQQHDGRWWFVDPEGHPFWSSGMDCVCANSEAEVSGLENALAWLPESDPGHPEIRRDLPGGEVRVGYLAANLRRAFGDSWKDAWCTLAFAGLRRFGFNTVGNWSDWRAARAVGFPYVRPLDSDYSGVPRLYRDLPDVFDARFEDFCRDFARQLEETKDDPAFIGYFLMNEPNWGFAEESPAVGMLFTSRSCAARHELARWLRERYASDAGLAAAWGLPVTISEVADSVWKHRPTPAAVADLDQFSAIIVDRFFGKLSRACRAVDPHHLNLGVRYYTVPPEWAERGMRHFDVFSLNCYKPTPPAEELRRISETLNQPVLIGEWHFGALDAGLPASGIRRVATQEDRGRAFRNYVESAAAQPWCVGAHYFVLYDQSSVGRFDGENYNIGFFDVCHRAYPPLAGAARAAHARLYPVALGHTAPFADAPDDLPPLFL